MQFKDWEIIKPGDVLIRETVRWKEESKQPDGTVVLAHAATTDLHHFQVIQIEHGVCTCVRLIERTELLGSRTTVTEVVELHHSGASHDARAACTPGGLPQYGWSWQAPARGEARLTGGFIVTRADGSQEFDRCPTDTTK